MGAKSRSIEKKVLNSIKIDLFCDTSEYREMERNLRQATMSFCVNYLKINKNEEEGKIKMERLSYLLTIFYTVFMKNVSIDDVCKRVDHYKKFHEACESIDLSDVISKPVDQWEGHPDLVSFQKNLMYLLKQR